MEKRKIWVRIGAYIEVTDKEMDVLIDNPKKGAEILKEKIEHNYFKAEGETYIPFDAVNVYNEEYGTDYYEDDYDFNL